MKAANVAGLLTANETNHSQRAKAPDCIVFNVLEPPELL
jgi:hypothetical protein